MDSDIAYLSGHELVRLYAGKDLSPVEVTSALLERAARFQPVVNAFVELASEEAMLAAGASQRRWLEGEPLGPLDGVPISIKDMFWVSGWRCRQGSLATDSEFRAPEDAPAVARLRDAGAVLLGRTAMPDYGWKPLCDSPLTGVTRNPWKLDRTPGGSTGGGAAAVALGLGPLAIGKDGGGSVRHPASFCGLAGLKPSFGRIPLFPRSGANDLTHVGPLARDAADIPAIMSVLAGPDRRDWFSLGLKQIADLDALHGSRSGLRIGWSTDFGGRALEPDVAQAFETALQTLDSLGAVLTEFPKLQHDTLSIYLTLCKRNNYEQVRPMTAEQRAVLDPRMLEFALSGREITIDAYYQAVTDRISLGAWFAGRFREIDLLVTPTMPTTAAFAEEADDDRPNTRNFWTWIPFTFPFNLTKQPAMTVNCGYSLEGLPIGLQIIGPLGGDVLVQRAAHQFELAAKAGGRSRRIPSAAEDAA